ncbi:MAG: hypothetical protein R3245_05530, partial [Kiloniellales bacterium]|nr:hypothetical protein [Kiloniellales bacterium]
YGLCCPGAEKGGLKHRLALMNVKFCLSRQRAIAPNPAKAGIVATGFWSSNVRLGGKKTFHQCVLFGEIRSYVLVRFGA